MNKLFFRVPFIALLVVAALYGATPSAKAQSGSGEDLIKRIPLTPEEWIPLAPKSQSGSELKLGSGLEIDNPKKVQVVIESLNDNAKEAGLSESLILAKVNLRLRQNGLIPIKWNSKNVNQLSYLNQVSYLYVNISVFNNAFNIGVAFHRPVFYSNNQLVVIASTWRIGGTGTFGGDTNFILNGLENYIDVFIDAYLSANNL